MSDISPSVLNERMNQELSKANAIHSDQGVKLAKLETKLDESFREHDQLFASIASVSKSVAELKQTVDLETGTLRVYKLLIPLLTMTIGILVGLLVGNVHL